MTAAMITCGADAFGLVLSLGLDLTSRFWKHDLIVTGMLPASCMVKIRSVLAV